MWVFPAIYHYFNVSPLQRSSSSLCSRSFAEHCYHDMSKRLEWLSIPMPHEHSCLRCLQCPLCTSTLDSPCPSFQEPWPQQWFFFSNYLMFKMAKVFQFLDHNVVYESTFSNVQNLQYDIMFHLPGLQYPWYLSTAFEFKRLDFLLLWLWNGHWLTSVYCFMKYPYSQGSYCDRYVSVMPMALNAVQPLDYHSLLTVPFYITYGAEVYKVCDILNFTIGDFSVWCLVLSMGIIECICKVDNERTG